MSVASSVNFHTSKYSEYLLFIFFDVFSFFKFYSQINVKAES